MGPLPSAGPSGLPPSATGAASPTTPSETVNESNPEAVGASGGVPLSGAAAGNAGAGAPAASPDEVPANNTANGDNSGAEAAPGTGSGGAMAGVDPAAGAGGSAMPSGVGGGSAVPPDEPAPPVVSAPPPPDPAPPVVGAGCGGAAIFCEDFDAIPLGEVQGTINGLRPERTVSIVDEPGRGRVLQVQAGATSANRNGVFLDDFDAPNNSHFGRAFIRVAQFPSAGGDHWVIVEVTSNNGPEFVRPVGGQFSRWAPGSDGASAGDWTDWEQSDAETVAGAWECVEWQVDGANGANDMLLWMNGQEIQPLDRPSFRLPAINTVWLGWVVFQNAQPPTYDVRFDDIVLSTERVGCEG